MSEFDTDHAVTPTAQHEYATAVSDRWTAFGGLPNGGHLLALCLRALSTELSHPDPLVVSAHYLRPAAIGPATVRTEVIRSGRRLATGEARLTQDEEEVVRVVASYSDLDKAAGRTEVFAEPPALPAPDACTDPLGGYTLPGIALTERLEFRAAKVPGWMTGAPGNDPRMELWVRFRDGRAPDPQALAAIVDFLPPVVVDLGETTSSTIELTVHVRKRPEPGWLACRVSTRFVLDGLHEEDFEIWDSAGNLVAQSRQLALLPT